MPRAIAARRPARPDRAAAASPQARASPQPACAPPEHRSRAHNPRFTALAVQTKLRVGAVDDPLEREADQVADIVMRDDDATVRRMCTECAQEEQATVRRQPVEDEEPDDLVQRAAAAGPAGRALTAGVARQVQATRRGGEPLSPDVRAIFEPRLGRDLSEVRVHRDATAADAASALAARAYTVGADIAFARGQYQPDTPGGRRLLAHELTHVVQQDENAQAARIRLQPEPGGALGPKHVERLRALVPELSGPVRTELGVQRILKALEGADMHHPIILRQTAELVMTLFPADIGLAFAAEMEVRAGQQIAGERQMQRTIGLMQVRRRGPYGTVGPGIMLPVIAGTMRPLYNLFASMLAYFRGILAGVRGNLSDADYQRLADRLQRSAVVHVMFAPILAAGVAVGLVELIVNAIRGTFELVANIDQVATAIYELVKLMASDEGPEIAEAFGREAGRRYAGQIRQLSGHGILRFTYEIGRLIGPMVVITVLTFVTGGAALGAALSSRLLWLLGRLRRGARFLERLRGMIRRRRPELPERAGSSRGPIEGAEEVRLPEAEYMAARGLVFPAHHLQPITRLVDQIGQGAARRAMTDPRFVRAVQNRNWTNAGTLFHSAAAREARNLPAGRLPSGWRLTAEETIQAGRGGSRADILLRGPQNEILEFDWKTSGRSALSSSSRQEMTRHAGQIRANIGGELTSQQSRSWMDYTREVWPNAPWP